MDERERVLGFKPQKEIIYNKLLPYAEVLDDESNDEFAEIKTNLARSVQLRDLKVGAGHWVGQLSKYIRLYGLKFSKEDHINLIHLLYELVVTPDLELSMVSKYASQLSGLLKKKKLLSREDLTLPWRPLYNVLESVLYSKYEPLGLQLFPGNIEAVLKNVVRDCRIYFSVESTQEMLDEWRPLLCAFDITVIKGLQYLELFLPTDLPEQEMDKGFRLWFQELMNMWDSFQNNPSWEKCLISLMSRLADTNIGYIDWSPYVSKVFSRLLKSFELPVGTLSVQTVRGGKTVIHVDTPIYVSWIINMMGGEGNAVQSHIDKLFQTLQTFYHPSNLGKWNIKLSSLLMSFPKVFTGRLHRERYKAPTWMKPVPEAYKLTNEDVTKFVESMKNTVFTSMFSKYGSQDAAVALRHLSVMRPELIVPPLLEKTYPAMETLIEPHRLIACMNCMVSVVRPMLSSHKWYPEGRSHLLPLLNLSLPGIDPNDFKKCLVTFQMISTFVSLVPLVDCSEALHTRTDLTEEERELCSATAQFEDFVLQFVDRVFALIENSAQEHVHGDVDRLNPEQTIVEKALASTFTSVLQQSSTPIFMSALKRLHSFIMGSVYESRVGGRYAANLVRAAQQVKPEETLKMFMNSICDSILELIDSHGEYLTAEHLDDGFLWNLLMFSQLLRCDGSKLLPYEDKITGVFSHILRLHCVQGYEIAGKSLMYILRALTLLFPLNYRSVPGSLDRPAAEFLAVRDWAKTGTVEELGMEWHIPSKEENDFAQKLVEKFLVPELDTIRQISTENTMPREDLLRRLNIIMECLNGVGGALPMWQGEHRSMIESQVPLKRFSCANSCGSKFEVTVKDGQNVRLAVIDAIRHLLNYMLSHMEDDTKSLHRLLRIYEAVLFFYGTPEADFEQRWKSFHAVKKALEDKMRGGKKHMRAILVDRVLLQHQMRCLQKTDRSFTARHEDLLQDLYKLSISRYSEVRKKAQSVLFQHFHSYPYSYRALVDPLVEKLLNPDISEHEFQGVLYVMLGNNKRNIPTKRSWEIISKVWPAITQAQHSEKPSLLNVIDQIVSKTVKNVETTAIMMKVSSGGLEAARRVLESQTVPVTHGPCTAGELQAAEVYESERNQKCQKMYDDLVTQLVQLVKGGTLRWKFSQIGLEFITLLLRHDTPLPTCAVELLIQKCVDDSLYLRKIGVASLMAIQKQLKRGHKKIKVDPLKQGVVSEVPTPQHKISPGDRPDNFWHRYNTKDLPDTHEKWESLTVVEKTHWGYYTWPKELETYAAQPEQPKLNRSREELSENERVIYNAFMDPSYIEKLVDFLALEENKGKDKFSQKKLTFFKGLFRNFGDCLLEHLKPHVERLISDTSHDKHDSSQRCAMEILAGALRGSKHWPYQQTKALWDWAIPLIKNAMNNLTVSTLADWSTFFTNVSESRDPRKIYWLYEMLMDNPLSGEGGSFGNAGRLLMIQNALLQQEWRVGDLHNRLMAYLKPHLTHPYKNVRDRMGSLLSDVFILDYKMFPWSVSQAPSRKDFIEHVLPSLHRLRDLVIEEAMHQNGTNGESTGSSSTEKLESSVEQMDIDNHSEESEERKELNRLCKTVMKCITNSINRTFNSAPAEVFLLLPIMCTLESESKDEELNTDCTVALAYLSQALLQPEVIPVILHTVKEITGLQSWHARSAVLGYIQVMVFCNFFMMQDSSHKEHIKETVMHLICDDKLEVREMASVTLSGLLQCGYLEMDKNMLDHFERLSMTKISKRVKSENVPMEKLIQRHAGVLGLCAYVQAYPYDVPELMPQILMDLSIHVNDPQPIQSTVKKTLSNFRRTHHDNWHDHKLMFTDDQLGILTDLLVSPNYYA